MAAFRGETEVHQPVAADAAAAPDAEVTDTAAMREAITSGHDEVFAAILQTAQEARDALAREKASVVSETRACISDLEGRGLLIRHMAETFAARARTADVIVGVSGAVIAVVSGAVEYIRDKEPEWSGNTGTGTTFTTLAVAHDVRALASDDVFILNLFVMSMGVLVSFTMAISQLFGWQANTITLRSVHAETVNAKTALHRVMTDARMALTMDDLQRARTSFLTREYDMYNVALADVSKWCTGHDAVRILPIVLRDARTTHSLMHDYRNAIHATHIARQEMQSTAHNHSRRSSATM